MLQEDFGHPLTRVLAWHACHLRLKQLLANPEELPIEEEENVEEVCSVTSVECGAMRWLGCLCSYTAWLTTST